MFKAVYNYISFSILGIVKVSFCLLLFLLTTAFMFKSEQIASLDYSSLFSGSSRVQILNSHLAENIQSAELKELQLENISPEEAEIFLFIMKLSNSITPLDAQKLAKVIVDECSTYELDPFLILAVIQTESSFIPKAVSPKGAIGLMQVMPKTGEYVAKDKGIIYEGRNSLYDPFVNVKLGIHYLSFLEERFESVEHALAAYNYGPSKFASSKSLADNPPKYVEKVLNFKNFLEEESILLAKSS